MEWQYFVLGLVAFQILKMLWMATQHELERRRDKRFLKFVNLVFKDSATVTLVSLDSSDKRAMAQLKEQVIDLYDLPEDLFDRVS